MFEQPLEPAPEPPIDTAPPLPPVAAPPPTNKLIINVETDVERPPDAADQTTHQPRDQLVAPTEILVTRCSAVLQAALVQQPGEQLRRLDQAIRQQLRDKQQIICDMFRVPREHFQVRLYFWLS